MHIAIFIYGMTGGGAQRRILTLMQEFVCRGHRIDLVTVMPGGELAPDVPAGVHVINLRSQLFSLLPAKGYRKLKLFCSRRALADYLNECKPEVLLSAASHTSLTSIAARRMSGEKTPLVLRLSSHLTSSHAGSLRLFRRYRYWKACQWFVEADAAIAVSAGIAEDIITHTNIAAERVHTIYNPTFNKAMLLQVDEPFHHPWLNGGGPPVILGVGRLTEHKDFPCLIKAFALLRRQRMARLVILGEGNLRGKLTRLVKDLGVSADVDMPGFVSNPLAWMSRASLFVLSSASEGLPGVLIEALAAGCPVVSTNCPSGPAEILENGRYGSLVTVGDHIALAKAIAMTLNSPHDTEFLRNRALAFSVDKAVDGYLEVLSRVVARSGV